MTVSDQLEDPNRQTIFYQWIRQMSSNSRKLEKYLISVFIDFKYMFIFRHAVEIFLREILRQSFGVFCLDDYEEEILE